MASVGGVGEIIYRELATLEVIPNKGYYFVHWNDGNTESPRVLTVTKDTTLMAILAITTHTVTVNVNDASMGTVVGGGEYELGEQAMLAAIPNKDCYFDHWNDGNTSNPRILTVTGDTTFTAVFAKYGSESTANENPEADNLRIYVQNRTIYLSEDRGVVQVYNAAGQCLYNGHATTIPVQQGGVYIVRVGMRSYKIMVR